MCSIEEIDEIARWPNSIPISCSLKLNLEGLLERIWDMMALVSTVTDVTNMCYKVVRCRVWEAAV